MPFLIIFILIPIVEIGVFMAVGDVIGLGWTLFFALFTAILGGAIIRYQGIQTLMAAQRDMQSAKMPIQEIFDGFCLVAAGATLITPGFVTDAIGFLLLVPPVRMALRALLGKSFKMSAMSGAAFGQSHQHGAGAPRQDDGVIEVDYERVNDNDNNEDKTGS